MAFETIKSAPGRRSTSPAIRISADNIYLNKFLITAIKARNVEIQVDKKTSQIRLIFREKETSSTRRVNRMPSAGSIAFKGIAELFGLKEAVTIDVQLEGNQVTGTYKVEKVTAKRATAAKK